MTINLDWVAWRFTWDYYESINSKKQNQKELDLQKIVNKLKEKTWLDIKQIVWRIWDHPNPNLLIQNLEEKENWEIMEILAKVIQNSSYSVERILWE